MIDRLVNFDDPTAVELLCDLMRGERGELQVVVKEPTRSLRQNKRYWKLCETAARLTSHIEGQPYTKDDIHYYLRKHCLTPVEHTDPFTGEVEFVPPSTASLTKTEFSVLMDKLEEIMARMKDENPSQRRLTASV